jgi:Aconitase A
MGVLPLQFLDGQNVQSLGLDGSETISVEGLRDGASKRATVTATAADGSRKTFEVAVMLLTPKEVEYFRHGGLLQYVLRQLAARG